MKKLIDAVKNLVIGLLTTGKHLGRHAVTLQYPKEKWEMPERSRGIVVLLSDEETGELNCTVCMLCARACPSYAIRIEYEKDEKKKRHLKDFIVDYNVCCFCGLCEDVCNFAAIKLAPKYEFSTLNKEDLIWHTDKLQEMGRDVPYEKPVRKKAVAQPAAKPAVKPAAKPVALSETENKSTAGPEKPTEDKPAEKPEMEAETEQAETKTPDEPEANVTAEIENKDENDKPAGEQI